MQYATLKLAIPLKPYETAVFKKYHIINTCKNHACLCVDEIWICLRSMDFKLKSLQPHCPHARTHTHTHTHKVKICGMAWWNPNKDCCLSEILRVFISMKVCFQRPFGVPYITGGSVFWVASAARLAPRQVSDSSSARGRTAYVYQLTNLSPSHFNCSSLLCRDFSSFLFELKLYIYVSTIY